MHQVLPSLKNFQKKKIGLLFDHGCDATMTGALSIIWTKCARTGPCIGGFAIFHTASTMFYFATMEEFFVGGLYQPTINGVSEGQCLQVILALACGMTGSNDFMIGEVVFGLTLTTIQTVLMVIGLIFFVWLK